MTLYGWLALGQVGIFWLATLVALVSVWRWKQAQLSELMQANDHLLQQLQQQQQHIADSTEQQQRVGSALDDVCEELSQLGQADVSLEEWEQIQALMAQQKAAFNDYLASEEQDKTELQKKLDDISRAYDKAQKLLDKYQTTQQNMTESARQLKQKVSRLSREVQSLKTLKVTSDRLQRDKQRLQEKVEALKQQYQEEKLLNRNLSEELKLSFRASEVKEIRDELNHAEESLKRTLAEKEFIERHFLELAEQGDIDELREQLDRKQREVQFLEQAVLDMDSDQQPTNDE